MRSVTMNFKLFDVEHSDDKSQNGLNIKNV